MKYLVIIFFVLKSFLVFNQEKKETIPQEFTLKLDSALRLMNDSLYFKANELFLSILDSNEVIPDNVCFYFGKNLFLTDYKNQYALDLNRHV